MSSKIPTWIPAAWYPLAAQRHDRTRPEPGMVVGLRRAAWVVRSVDVLPREEWTPEDVQKLSGYAERNATGRDNAQPFRVEVEWLGGVVQERLARAKETVGVLTFRGGAFPTWWVYPHGRWPKCSCCGEPMPCRAELADLKVDAAVERMEEFASRLPGTCWGCGEPVTSRHRTVRYPGENLDSPCGPEVVFHARQSCWHSAARYEKRWLAADPSRRRQVTYPRCPGWLVWHADGSDECIGGDSDCGGLLTHNHGSQAGCRYINGGCPRGCPPGKSTVRTKTRPTIRPAGYPQGRPDGSPMGASRDVGEEDDGRESCPGTLMVHKDGSTECRAGGLDDCWDGSKYRHALKRDCASLTHGCPKCETTEGLA